MRQRDKKLHISISSDGQRVMALQADAAHLLEIGDSEFIHKTQTIRKPARAKPVERLQVFNARGSLSNPSLEQG